jgi:acyl carrier protein
VLAESTSLDCSRALFALTKEGSLDSRDLAEVCQAPDCEDRRIVMSSNAEEIRTRIKQIIANVAGLNAGRINDDARWREDLKLDSLSLLEIGVDVDLAFKLELPDERYKEIDSLPGMVDLVQQRLGERMEQAEAVQG